jgi:hypothetical protein
MVDNATEIAGHVLVDDKDNPDVASHLRISSNPSRIQAYPNAS